MTAARRASLNRLNRADWVWIVLFLAGFGTLVARNYLLGQTEVPVLPLGPLRLSPFGLLVALDMLFAYHLAKRWCETFDLEWQRLAPGVVWIALLGLYISHLVSIAFYFPHDLTDPIALLDARTRISSFGGFYGGALVAILYMKRKGLPIWPTADALVYGFVGGYIFGRMGCFAIHDHPGTETDFFLGIPMAGVRRHDLGLYEMFLMLFLLIALHLLARGGRPAAGRAVALVCTIYMPVRFLFDYLRIDDPRYAGLTPGQWMAIPLFLVGLWAWGAAARLRAAEG
ncbi:MAG: prolipoprotein diacylglyceryl transferase [Thermoanaerobaculia bacterium]|nr:prolipoprotein diacylglyceryl transferase [Thermoanaerobaculia bacterium]